MQFLIRLPNHVGDCLLSLSAIRALHRLYPHATLHVIVAHHLASWVSYFPHIAVIYPLPRKRFRGLLGGYRYASLLAKRRRRYDYFFSFPDSFSSAWMGFLLKAKKRIGFRSQGRNFLLTHAYAKPKGLHRAEEYTYLAYKSLNKDIIYPLHTAFDASVLPKVGKIPAQSYGVVNFVSANFSRNIPMAQALRYLQMMAQEKRISAHTLLFVGTKAHRPYYEELLDAYAKRNGTQKGYSSLKMVNMAAQTTLLELTRLISQAAWVLSTDSGPAHMAGSLQRPLVTLMGAGEPDYIAPYTQKDHPQQKILIARHIPCVPCQKATCRFHYPHCLYALSAPQVTTALIHVLRATKMPTKKPR